MDRTYVLGMAISSTDYADSVAKITAWAQSHESRYICVATVNQVMEGYDHSNVRTVINEADLITPDGMPLVWALRLLGRRDATRVYGPDLTPMLLQAAEQATIPVGFYGASQQALQRLVEVARKRYPDLQIAYSYSPPFRPLTPEEDERIVSQMNSSGSRILFVGLSSPKQDQWMAAHRGQVHAVMVGVGAAFDFLSGSKNQAPRWMMPLGLEWLFRLCSEPRRLWKRYLKHNPRFLVLFAAQLIRARV